MTLITLEEAEQEFVESVAYYESQEPGLGLRFRNEVGRPLRSVLTLGVGEMKIERTLGIERLSEKHLMDSW